MTVTNHFTRWVEIFLMPDQITRPSVTLALRTSPAQSQSNSDKVTDTLSDSADHKYHLPKRSLSLTKPSRTSLSTVPKLTPKFEKPSLQVAAFSNEPGKRKSIRHRLQSGLNSPD